MGREQPPADAVERLELAAPVTEGCLLDAPAHRVEGLVDQAHGGSGAWPRRQDGSGRGVGQVPHHGDPGPSGGRGRAGAVGAGSGARRGRQAGDREATRSGRSPRRAGASLNARDAYVGLALDAEVDLRAGPRPAGEGLPGVGRVGAEAPAPDGLLVAGVGQTERRDRPPRPRRPVPLHQRPGPPDGWSWASR